MDGVRVECALGYAWDAEDRWWVPSGFIRLGDGAWTPIPPDAVDPATRQQYRGRTLTPRQWAGLPAVQFMGQAFPRS